MINRQILEAIRERVEAFSRARGVAPERLTGRGRTKDVVPLRQEVMHDLAAAGYSARAIGRAMKRDYSTVMGNIRAHRRRVGLPPLEAHKRGAKVDLGMSQTTPERSQTEQKV